jgi:hypothetical protein
MPKVNQAITRNKKIFTRKGTVHPNLFWKIISIGGKYSRERSRRIMPGRGCTNNRFNIPMVTIIVPIIQLTITDILLSIFIIYDPANGVPKRPTASSIQISRSASNITPQMISLFLVLLTFLITSSHSNPVPSNKTPPTIKSAGDQFTSFVNCIAINGINNNMATVPTMPKSRLFCVSIVF